jgi:formate dehydrogenase major subunit
MGCTPGQLTGGAPVEQVRASFERVWGAPLPSRPGLTWMQMLDAAGEGTLKGLYAIGYDVLLSNPNADQTRRALARLELLIVQDMFMTETARELAHVMLPVACSFEKEGTFMSSERRVQRVRKSVEPPPGVPTDTQLICALAAALDHPQGFHHACASEVWDEVRAVWPAGAGMSYERLERPGGLQWPCPDEDHPGSERLYAGGFDWNHKAVLKPVPYVPSPEREDAEYPYVLVTGRLLYQFNAATMTGRTPNQELQPSDVLRIAPGDAAREGLESGRVVLVRSRHGCAQLTIAVDEAQRPGELFATFHDPRVLINRVTGNVRDRYTHTPEYKRTAVRLERPAASQAVRP